MSQVQDLPREVSQGYFLIGDLPSDVLGSILRFTDAASIGRLALGGSRPFQAKLALPYVVKELSITVPAGHTKWPSVVSFFPQLHSLEVKCAANASYIALEGFEASHLSKELRNLRFEFANDFVCFIDHDPDSADASFFNSDGLRLCDMSAILPHLERYEFIAAVAHSELFPNWPSNLPSTLQSIHLPHFYEFTYYMISELPRSLTDLELTLNGWSQIEETAPPNVWPKNLSRLHLNQVKTLSIMESLPDTLTDLSLDGLRSDSLFGSTRSWQLIERLKSLQTFSSSCLKIDTELALSLGSLPDLKDLSLSFIECDPLAMRYLPRDLKRLSLYSEGTDRIFGVTSSWDWSYLPTKLEYLKTPGSVLLGASEAPEEWKKIPRNFQDFGFEISDLNADAISQYRNDLPPTMSNLQILDVSTRSRAFYAPGAKFQKTISTLQISGTDVSEELIPFIRGCSSLKNLRIWASPVPSASEIVDFPPQLETISMSFNGLLSDLNLSQLSWTQHITQISFTIRGGVPDIPDMYRTLPRTLTFLVLLSTAELDYKGFSGLPRGLNHLMLNPLSDGIDDESLESLPPSLGLCQLRGATFGRYSLKAMLSLPMTLSQLVLPPPRLPNAVLNAFIEQRPYLSFTTNRQSIPSSESTFRKYKKEHLTLGSVKPRYR